MLRSLRDWLADQAAELARPITHRMAADVADRLVVDVVVTVHTGGHPR